MMVNADGLLVVKVAALICLQIVGATGNGPETLIMGGVDARRGQFPWQVQVIGTHPVLGSDLFLCGGSIIGASWVLTAGHCINGAKVILVFGSLLSNLSDTLEPGSFNDTSGITFLHEDYQEFEHLNEHNFIVVNDIALIRLRRPLKYSDVIQPVKLPRRSHRTKTFEGETVIVSGWGQTGFEGPALEISANLQYVDFVISKDTLFENCLANHFICNKATETKAALQGDSGDPVVWRDEFGGFVQIGITSQLRNAYDDSGNGHITFTNAFTFVPYYLDWIAKKTGIRIAH